MPPSLVSGGCQCQSTSLRHSGEGKCQSTLGAQNPEYAAASPRPETCTNMCTWVSYHQQTRHKTQEKESKQRRARQVGHPDSRFGRDSSPKFRESVCPYPPLDMLVPLLMTFRALRNHDNTPPTSQRRDIDDSTNQQSAITLLLRFGKGRQTKHPHLPSPCSVSSALLHHFRLDTLACSTNGPQAARALRATEQTTMERRHAPQRTLPYPIHPVPLSH